MNPVPASEIQRRHERLREALASTEPRLDGLLVLDQVNRFYLSGTVQDAHLICPAEGAPALRVRKVLERAREDSPLEDIEPLTSLKDLGGELEKVLGPAPWRLGLELDVLPARSLKLYEKILGDRVEFHDASGILAGLRSVKSSWELEQIRDSARINRHLYEALPEVLSRELSTYALQSILNCRACLDGHLGLVRMRGFNVDGLIGVVASGPTGALPGHSAFPIGGLGPHASVAHGGDHEPIRPHVPVIFDYLANRSGYHHDQTRLAVIGKLDRRAREIYEGMQGLLRAVEARLKPGAIPSAIYEEILDLARQKGLDEGFMGAPGLAVPFIGHALGLEVNETPVLARKFDAPLVAGNVLAVEPKFTHADFGVIGIENTYAIVESGAENLGDTPEDVIEVPA